MSDKTIIALVVGLTTLAIAVAVPLVLWSARDPAPSSEIVQAPKSRPSSAPVSLSRAATTPSREVAKATTIRTIDVPATRVVASKPFAVTATAPAIANSSFVTGAAWLNRTNGTSDLLRGLPVRLLRPTMPSATVLRCFALDLEERKAVMRDYMELPAAEIDKAFQGSKYEERREQAKDRHLSAATIDTKTGISIVSALYGEKREAIQKMIRDGEQKASELRLERKPLAADLLSIQVEKWAALLMLEHRVNAVPLDGLIVAEAESDSEGKFAVENVPPGDYYLHAELSSTEVFIEWAIPVRVKADGPAKVNLHNGNALIVVGR